MARLKWFVVLMLAGCYAPGLDGKFACGVDGSCPPGLSCIAGACGGAADLGTEVDAGRKADASMSPPADLRASCQPASCSQGACGTLVDGCGSSINCGTCPNGQVCGAHMPNVCNMGPPCMPATCQKLKADCGTISDGCSMLLTCGTCDSDQTCGAKMPNKCD